MVEFLQEPKPDKLLQPQNVNAGSVQQPNKEPVYQPQPQETVEGRLTSLLEKDNPYLQVARTGALQEANKRGLLNSTIAAGAGEKAAIESALPIAQQDAGFLQNRSLQSQSGDISSRLQSEQGDITSRLQGEQGDIQEKLYNVQGDISSRLQSEQGDITSRLQGEQGDISSRLQSEQGDITSRLQGEAGQIESGHIAQRGVIESGQIAQRGAIDERLAQIGYTHERAMQDAEIEWNKIDLQARMDIELAKMSQEDQARWNETTNQIASEYTQNYLAILADPAYATDEDRQVAIDVLNEATRDRYSVAGIIAGQDIDWGLTIVNPEDDEDKYVRVPFKNPPTGSFAAVNYERVPFKNPPTGSFAAKR